MAYYQERIVLVIEKKLQRSDIDLLFNIFHIRQREAAFMYPQSNGQTEIANKTIADDLGEKMMATMEVNASNYIIYYALIKRQGGGKPLDSHHSCLV